MATPYFPHVDPLVCVFPQREQPAWNPVKDPAALKTRAHEILGSTVPLSEALTSTYDTWAMLSPPVVFHPKFPEGLSFRPQKSLFRDPTWAQVIRWGVMLVDLDGPGHSVPTESWYRNQKAAAQALGALFYSTVHGCRLVWVLPHYMGVEEFRDLQGRVEKCVKVLCSEGWDPATADQPTRLYGLPNITRDDGPYEAEFQWPNPQRDILLDIDAIESLIIAKDLPWVEDGIDQRIADPVKVPIREIHSAGDGSRNSFAFRKACRWKALGFSDEEIWTRLVALNDDSITPPLDEEELEQIYNSAITYDGPTESPTKKELKSIKTVAEVLAEEEPPLDPLAAALGTPSLLQVLSATISQIKESDEVKESHDAPLPDCSGVTLAQRTKSKLMGQGDHKTPIAFCEGNYWKYDRQDGIWKVLGEVEIRSNVMTWWHGHLALDGKGRQYSLALGNGKIIDVMACLQTIVQSETGDDFFRNREHGVTFRNGFVNREGRLAPYSPLQKSRFRLDFDYEPNGPVPNLLVNTLLGGCWKELPDKDQLVQLLREALGVSLMGLAPTFQRAYLLYGGGENGKSQVLDIVSGLFPEEVRCSVAPQKLGEEYYAAQLPGKRINVQPEIPDRAFADSGPFKAGVSGDVMSGRHPAGRAFHFKAEAAFWFASNHLPHTKDLSHGFFRRWVLFPFPRPIPKSEQIKDLGRKILEEESGAIASWAIASVPEVLRRGDYVIPPSCADLMGRWRGNVEPLSAFFIETYLSEGKYLLDVPCVEFFRKYAHHADMSAQKPMPKPEFYEHVVQHYGANKVKRNGKRFMTVDLRHLVTDDIAEVAYGIFCNKERSAGKEVPSLTLKQFCETEGLNHSCTGQ